jgi:hypothetical protein
VEDRPVSQEPHHRIAHGRNLHDGGLPRRPRDRRPHERAGVSEANLEPEPVGGREAVERIVEASCPHGPIHAHTIRGLPPERIGGDEVEPSQAEGGVVRWKRRVGLVGERDAPVGVEREHPERRPLSAHGVPTGQDLPRPVDPGEDRHDGVGWVGRHPDDLPAERRSHQLVVHVDHLEAIDLGDLVAPSESRVIGMSQEHEGAGLAVAPDQVLEHEAPSLRRQVGSRRVE